ncbi:hypothetical protein Tco_0977821 [Tanacetum coccineum]|uniref:Reverse transcriptase domain-containing protein n=1 Tax=Tanacetum coccineum TaxID=301880 RepID=A0ABQ5EL70_9ASTR
MIAVLRNIQNQVKYLQTQMANLTDMLSKFVTTELLLKQRSSFRSGNSPGNTFTNPKEDLKRLTPPAITGSTEDDQPPVVQNSLLNQNPEPNVAPVFLHDPKASIHFHQEEMMKAKKKKLTSNREIL